MKRVLPFAFIGLLAVPALAAVQWSVTDSYSPPSPMVNETVEKRITVTLDVGSDSATCEEIGYEFQGGSQFPASFAYDVSFDGWRQNLLSACKSAHSDNQLDPGDGFTFTIATLTPPVGGVPEESVSLVVNVQSPGKPVSELASSFTPVAASGDVLTVSLDPYVSGCTQTACPLVVEATGANAGLGKGDVTLRYRPSGGTWQSNGMMWPIYVNSDYYAAQAHQMVVPVEDLAAYQYARNVVNLTPNTTYDFEVTANGQTATATLTTRARPDPATAIANADSSVTVSTPAALQAAIDDAANHAAGGHVIRLATAVFDVSAGNLSTGTGNLIASEGNEIVITADTDTCPLDAVRNALITTGEVQPAEDALYDNGDPTTGNPLCPIIDGGDVQGRVLAINGMENVIIHGIAFANAHGPVLDWNEDTTNVSIIDSVFLGSAWRDTPKGQDDVRVQVAAGPAVEVGTYEVGIPVVDSTGVQVGDTVKISGESNKEYESEYEVVAVSPTQINIQLSDASNAETNPETFLPYTFAGQEYLFSTGPDGYFACGYQEYCNPIYMSGSGGYVENNIVVGAFDFGYELNGGSSKGIAIPNESEARWNTIAGVGDAGLVGPFGATWHHNEVLWASDDGVEIDGVVRNTTVHNNLLMNVGRAFSFAECYAGPCVAAKNIVWNTMVPVKAKKRLEETTGWHVVNNTFLSAWPEWFDFNSGGDNATVVNNLFIGNGTANNRGARYTFRAVYFRPNAMLDHNAWANDARFRSEWTELGAYVGSEVTVDSLAAWQATMNGYTLGDGTTITVSQNSITLESGSGGAVDGDPTDNTYQDPVFVGEASGPAANTGQVVLDLGGGSYVTRRVSADQTATDWHDWFEPTGALLDAGTNLFSQWTGGYAGTAPDIGAVEAGDTLPRYGARGEQTPLAAAADALTANTMTYFSTQNWYEVMHSGPIGDPNDISTYTLLKGGINWVSHGVWCASCGTAGYVFNRGQAEGEGGENPVADRLRRYDVAANEWIAVNTPTNGNHGYAHTAIDEVGQRVFSKRAGENPIDVWDTETLTHLGSFSGPSVGFANIWGFTIHPNLGTHGRLYAINITGGTNDVYYIDLPASGVPSGSWTTAYSGFGTTGNGTFNQGSSMAHYHPTLDAILFGATSGDQNEMFQIDNTGALTQLDDSPVPFRVPALSGYGGHMIPVPNQPYWEYWAACPDDPHDGNQGPTCRHRLDPSAAPGSQWTNLGELDRTVNSDPRNGAIAQRWFTTVIPEHGVVLVVDENATNMLYSFD